MEFTAPAPPISMNEGDTWRVRAAAAAWHEAAYFHWCERFPSKGPTGRRFPEAEVFVSLGFPRGRRRDPINFAKTVKHIVDGIKDAGAWEDDTLEFVTQHIPTLRVDPSGLAVVRVVERLASPG